MKKLIIFFLFGIVNIFLIGGCGKADNRVVLHSEATDDSFWIKASNYGNPRMEVLPKISKSELAAAIENRVTSVSEVYDIADILEGYDQWYIVFSVTDTSGRFFKGFKCLANLWRNVVSPRDESDEFAFLRLQDCGTDHGDGAQFHNSDIKIPLEEVIYY